VTLKHAQTHNITSSVYTKLISFRLCPRPLPLYTKHENTATGRKLPGSNPGAYAEFLLCYLRNVAQRSPVPQFTRTKHFHLHGNGADRGGTILRLHTVLSNNNNNNYYYYYYLLSPLCRVFTIIYRKQTVFLGYITLQLFCNYNIWYM
jgi:hypothetical protein